MYRPGLGELLPALEVQGQATQIQQDGGTRWHPAELLKRQVQLALPLQGQPEHTADFSRSCRGLGGLRATPALTRYQPL
jgi:hypothetical protein